MQGSPPFWDSALRLSEVIIFPPPFPIASTRRWAKNSLREPQENTADRLSANGGGMTRKLP